MTLTEFEEEANAYCRSVVAASDALDQQWNNPNPDAPDKGPPAFAVPDLAVWHELSDAQRDFIRRAEQDTHLGRSVLVRALQPIGDVAPGECARTTPTEAAEAVRVGWAEYVPEPVVRPAFEQVARAVRINRAGLSNP